ncbi:MAG: hypothetical protein ACQERN_11480, partial [Thermodesulfobacteriota bacterium]
WKNSKKNKEKIKNNKSKALNFKKSVSPPFEKNPTINRFIKVIAIYMPNITKIMKKSMLSMN